MHENTKSQEGKQEIYIQINQTQINVHETMANYVSMEMSACAHGEKNSRNPVFVN